MSNDDAKRANGQVNRNKSHNASRAPRFSGLAPATDEVNNHMLGSLPSTPKRKPDDLPPFKARFKLGSSSSERSISTSSSPISRLPFRIPSSPAAAMVSNRDQGKHGENPNTPVRPPKFAINSSTITESTIISEESGSTSSYLVRFSEFYPFFDDMFCNFVKGGLMDTLRGGVCEYSSKPLSESRVSYRLLQIDVKSSYFVLCRAIPISLPGEEEESLVLLSFDTQSIQKLVTCVQAPKANCLFSLGNAFLCLGPEYSSDGCNHRMYFDWILI